MNARSKIRGWRQRPIAEHERKTMLAAAALLLAAATLALSLTRPRTTPEHTAEHRSPSVLPDRRARQPASISSPAVLTWTEARAARLFLTGYLAYLYGHAPAGTVTGATRGLLRSLESHPARASFDIRARRPRVLALRAVAAPPGMVEVRALVGDGGSADYTIGVFLARSQGRLLVSGLGQD